MAVESARIVLLACGGAMVVLAGTVLSLDPRRLLHRALATLIALRGMVLLVLMAGSGPTWAWAGLQTQPYFVLPLVPIALLCLFAIRPAQERLRGAGWWALGAAVALDLAYFADHTLFHTLAPGEASNGAMQAADGIQYTAFGPLAAIGILATPLLGFVGLGMVLRERRRATSDAAPLGLLVGGALVVGALFDGTNRLIALADLLDTPAGFAWLPWGWSVMVMPAVALLPAIAGVAALAAYPNATRSLRHSPVGRLLLLAGVMLTAGLARLLVGPNPDPGGSTLGLVMLGLSRLLVPVLVTYALALHGHARLAVPLRDFLAWTYAAGLAVGFAALAWMLAARLPTPWPVLAAVAAAAAIALFARRLLEADLLRWILPPAAPVARPDEANAGPAGQQAQTWF